MDYIRRATVALTAISSLLVLSTACSKKDDVGRMRIVMPTAPATSKSISSGLQSVSAQSANGTSWNSTINPTSGNEINCFAVFVGGGELGANSCSISNGTTISFGPHVGFLKAGEEIFIDTPAGDRTVYVIGLKSATAAACSNFSNTEPDGANLSEPFLIAAQRSNIPSGQSTLTINAALDTGKKVQDCNFISPTGGGQQNPFGDKRDGKIIAATSFAYLDGGMDNLGVSGINHISGAGQLASTKMFSSSRRITGIATAGADAGKLVSLSSAVSTAEFEPGDEVLWYVAGGASSLGSPDDPTLGACGGSLFLGRFGTSKIVSLPNSSQLLLESAISTSPSTIRTANLLTAPNTNDYCTIVVTRVSSFEQIDVPSGMTLQISPNYFNYTSGTGGIVAIRADAVTVDGDLYLSANGAGFAGGGAGAPANQGGGLGSSGVAGYSSNYNGGGGGNMSTVSGGSGSNAGAGGAGSSNPGSGGSLVSHCSGVCTPFIEKKSYFGGGGGGAYTSGGNGGGIVLLFAKSISGSGNLHIKADGLTGGSGPSGGGSGAGGTVGLYTKSATVGQITVQAKGANGATGGAGGGGGGVVDIKRCPAGWSSVLNTDASGGAPNGAGTAGGNGLVNISDDAAICSIN